MNYWIVKQLRAAVVTDLAEFIPTAYFERERESFELDRTLEHAQHASFELRWGYLAGSLGHSLFFESSYLMSARQVAASEILMHLGLLAGAEAAMQVCLTLEKKAKDSGIPDGNCGVVGQQLASKQIPQLRSNLLGGLKQYLRHLSPAEAEPFTPLLVPAQTPPIF